MGIRVNSAAAAVMPTVRVICSLSNMDYYLIGLTQLSALKKGASYRSIEFHHLVVLADQLSANDAIALERALQNACRDDLDVCRAKYHPEKSIDKTHYPSIGGSKKTDALYSVYMAWVDQE